MSYFSTITSAFPNALPTDFRLELRGDEIKIAYWNEDKLGPRPSLDIFANVPADMAAAATARAAANSLADGFYEYWTSEAVPQRVRDYYEPWRVVVNERLRSGDTGFVRGFITNMVNVFGPSDPDCAAFETVRSTLLGFLPPA